MKQYVTGLDLVRIFAAVWVMNFHFLMRGPVDSNWYRYGPYGVQLFFVVSGFVILESVSKGSVRAFAIGRFIRLYPIFWIICTLTYALTFLWPGGNPVSLRAYILSMSIVGCWFSAQLVDYSYWSLSVEVFFYAFVALFVWKFTVARVRWFLVSWFLCAVVAFALHFERNILMKLLLVRHASYFIFGAFLSLRAMDEQDRPYLRAFDWVALIAVGAFATFIHPRAVRPFEVALVSDGGIVNWIHVAIFAGVALVVWVSRYMQGKRVRRVCEVLGGLTYPLYLIHQTAGKLLIASLNQRLSRPVSVLLIEAVMIGLAYLFFRQDKTLRKYLRKRLLPQADKMSAPPLLAGFSQPK